MTPVQLVQHIKKHENRWLGLPGVRGVGGTLDGDDGWIVVYADHPIMGVPSEIDGVQVVVQLREGAWCWPYFPQRDRVTA